MLNTLHDGGGFRRDEVIVINGAQPDLVIYDEVAKLTDTTGLLDSYPIAVPPMGWNLRTSTGSSRKSNADAKAKRKAQRRARKASR